MVRLLTDADVRRLLSPEVAVAAAPGPLTHLGRLVAEPGDAARGGEAITLYCSTGLAGSEVVLAAALL